MHDEHPHGAVHSLDAAARLPLAAAALAYR
jgi:hypothetical protein